MNSVDFCCHPVQTIDSCQSASSTLYRSHGIVFFPATHGMAHIFTQFLGAKIRWKTVISEVAVQSLSILLGAFASVQPRHDLAVPLAQGDQPWTGHLQNQCRVTIHFWLAELIQKTWHGNLVTWTSATHSSSRSTSTMWARALRYGTPRRDICLPEWSVLMSSADFFSIVFICLL